MPLESRANETDGVHDYPPTHQILRSERSINIIPRPTSFTVSHNLLFSSYDRSLKSETFADSFMELHFSKAREILGLSVVERYSLQHQFGYTAEEITIPDNFTPELVKISHQQPERYRAASTTKRLFGEDIIEDRIIFTHNEEMVDYAERARDSFGSDASTEIPGINAGLFDLAVAQFIAKDRSGIEVAHGGKITLGIPQLEASNRAIDTLTMSEEQRRSEGIWIGIPGRTTGFVFVSLSVETIRGYYKQNQERIDKYLYAISLAEEQKNPRPLDETWHFPPFLGEIKTDRPHFSNEIGVTKIVPDGSSQPDEEIVREHPNVFQLNAIVNHQFAAMAAIIAGNWQYYDANVRGSTYNEQTFQSAFGELRGREIGLPLVSGDQYFFHPSTQYLDWGLQSVSHHDSRYYGLVNEQSGYTHVHPGIYSRAGDPNYYHKFESRRGHKIASALQQLIMVPVIGKSALKYLRERKRNPQIERLMHNIFDQTEQPPSPGDISIFLNDRKQRISFVVVPPIFANGEEYSNAPGLVYAFLKRGGKWKPSPPYNNGLLARLYSTPRTERMEARFLRKFRKAAHWGYIPRVVKALTSTNRQDKSFDALIREGSIPYADLLNPYGVDVYIATLPLEHTEIGNIAFHRIIPSHPKHAKL